ncbi:CREB-regulated transcription coactivator 3 isoform X2 [Anopheles darlingi]|uniref:CREB-regulated transcription coactivator 3 isoform X2 n=1 Tax=Anopheles darlingi TaxID=43151 RepID=UPI00210034FD|nr:CREB-regulated transcription coactivator 3 isoform X2 [Anopheles darlingi]XP_049535024.1 CREB-regulated transcription coactivator 3 isoform X2 [Anopheles darlingi]XP_049535026.1 CREB-regulated transcription coactivator 3 isoform X2 [Anopheles darlingi]XP_049535027.1 CREB-regulated transcription coactivator 3 isoform X2 [Anopheles darlingi]
MANPRKFSEKIALHNQKQAEETAEFERIMREVSDVTSKTDDGTNMPEMKIYPQPETVKIKKEITPKASTPSHARESRGRTPGGPMRNRQASRNHDTSPYGNSTVHLIPPMENSWHRSISDSAIHQSLCQNQQQDVNHLTTHSPLTLSPTVQRKISNAQQMSKVHNPMTNHHNHLPHHNHHNNHHDNGGGLTQDIRSRSSTALPRLPGINIYPSQNHPDSIQIPIPSNTGSLPDLTSVGYPSMYPATLDQEYDPSGQNHSYCPSPLGTSPSSLSPTSAIQNHHHHPHPRANSFSGGVGVGSSGVGGGSSMGNTVPATGGYPIPTSHSNSGSVSPTGSGISCSPSASNSVSLVNHNNNGSVTALNNGIKNKKTKPQTISSQPFLSVPDSNRYSFMSKVNNTYDNSQQQQSPQQHQQQSSQAQSPQQGQQQPQQQRIPPLDQINYDSFTQISDGLASPNHNSPESILYGSHGNVSPQIMSDYRSRPSPGSSPGLALVNNPDSNSSAPCSPVSHNIGSNNGQSYDKYPTSDGYVQNTLPQYLEHITLCDSDFTTNQMVFSGFDDSYMTMNNSMGMRTHVGNQGNGQLQNHQTVTQQNNQLNSVNCQNMQNMQNNSINNMFNGTTEPLLSLPNTQSLIEPQTPTIPEIVFTDYSTRDDFEADLGLGHMDFQSIQMLSDTSTMIDPMDEDSFRRDLQ